MKGGLVEYYCITVRKLDDRRPAVVELEDFAELNVSEDVVEVLQSVQEQIAAAIWKARQDDFELWGDGECRIYP